MSSLRIDINRLQLTLQDVPEAVAVEAVAGLSNALSARLESLARHTSPAVIGELELRDVTAPPDATRLREAIADRLVERLLDLTGTPKETR